MYIRSVTEPFDEEMELDTKRIDNWLGLFDLQQYGRTGDDRLHASGTEIVDMIKTINPRKIIPIHTEHPSHLTNYFENVTRVEQGETLKL